MPTSAPAVLAAPSSPTVWTPERDAELIRLKQDGLNMATIAAQLGTTPRAVENRTFRLRKAGHAISSPIAAPEPKVWTEAKDAELLALLREGLAGVAVAERMGMTPGSIHDRRRRLRAMGVDVPALPKGVGIERAIEARRVWTPELDARLVEMYRRGKTDIDIAAGLGNGISAGAVSVRVGILRKAGKIEALSRRAIRAAKGARPLAKQSVAAVASEQKSEPVLQAKRAADETPRVGRDPFDKIVQKPSDTFDKLADAAPDVPRTAGGIELGKPRTARVERPDPVSLIGLTAAQKADVIAQHVFGLPAHAGFDAELDLELCEAVFSNKGGLALFATNLGIDQRIALARFDTIVAPFRTGGGKALPIEAAGLILPALRARVAKARGAAA